jgi:integrase
MTGHIRRRGKASWELKFELGRDPVTGKRLTRYQSFRGTKREAEKKLIELLGQAEAGLLVKRSKETLGDYVARWTRDWVPAHVTPKTGERYLELLRLHVCPRLGALPLQRVRPAHLSELYATLLREGRGDGRGLAARTVGHCHRVLHRVLAVAVAEELLPHNPADRVKPPRVEAQEIEILAEEQVGMVLGKLHGRVLYPIVALALATGLRRGELLALTWGNLDFEASRLRVDRALEETKGGLRFKPPKTRHGRRTVSLAPWIVSELREHRKAHQEQRIRLGIGQLPNDALVFPNANDEPRSPNSLSKEWRRMAARLELPAVNFHAFRHTHASQLIAAGMDVLTISRRLGHSSPTITLNIYAHLFSNTDNEAAQIVERAFGGIASQTSPA